MTEVNGNDPTPSSPVPQGNSQGVYVDTAHTYRLSFISLAVGTVIAAIVGGLLYSLRQGPSLDAQGNPQFAIGMIMVPIAAIASVGIMAWAIFDLPVRIAKRQGVILDPEVYPWTGAIGLGVVIVVGFFAAIAAGLI